MNVTVPNQLIAELLNYLSQKPYSEVVGFIQTIEGLRNSQAKALRDAEIERMVNQRGDAK